MKILSPSLLKEIIHWNRVGPSLISLRQKSVGYRRLLNIHHPDALLFLLDRLIRHLNINGDTDLKHLELWSFLDLKNDSNVNRAVDLLERGLTSSPKGRRLRYIKLLAKIRPKSARILNILMKLIDSKDSSIRKEAYVATQEMGSFLLGQVNNIANKIEDPKSPEDEKVLALGVLERLFNGSEEKNIPKDARDDYVNLGSRVNQLLLSIFSDSKKNPQMRRAAGLAITTSGTLGKKNILKILRATIEKGLFETQEFPSYFIEIAGNWAKSHGQDDSLLRILFAKALTEKSPQNFDKLNSLMDQIMQVGLQSERMGQLLVEFALNLADPKIQFPTLTDRTRETLINKIISIIISVSTDPKKEIKLPSALLIKALKRVTQRLDGDAIHSLSLGAFNRQLEYLFELSLIYGSDPISAKDWPADWGEDQLKKSKRPPLLYVIAMNNNIQFKGSPGFPYICNAFRPSGLFIHPNLNDLAGPKGIPKILPKILNILSTNKKMRSLALKCALEGDESQGEILNILSRASLGTRFFSKNQLQKILLRVKEGESARERFYALKIVMGAPNLPREKRIESLGNALDDSSYKVRKLGVNHARSIKAIELSKKLKDLSKDPFLSLQILSQEVLKDITHGR